MNAPEALGRARATFEARLVAVEPSAWDLPTPCTDWSVGRLASHVVGCARLYTMLLEGADGAEVVLSLRQADLLGDDPLSACRAAWGELAAVLEAPGALETTVRHPAGELPASWLTVLAVEELVLHGWDLARATGGDEAIDEEVAAWLLAPLRDMLPAFGPLFQPPAGPLPAGPLPAGPLPAGAVPSEQLLELTGRRS